MPPSTSGLLQNKTAIVTGGSRGIGSAIVARFLAEGAHVHYTSRTAPAEAADRAVHEDAVWHVCDGADESAVVATMAEILQASGRVDVLVNNAGGARDSFIHRMSIEDFRYVVDVNLQASWLWTREALRHMRARDGGGSIVNISSIAAKAGNLAQANYAAAKAGVGALTLTTAREGARFDIRANAIRPGFIETDMTDVLSGAARDDLLKTIPMERPGSATEVADVALFLASDMSSYMTGAVLDVSGGRYM